MKFEYELDAKETREVVAETFYMTDHPEKVCLNLYKSDSHDVVTLYYDGVITVQPNFDTRGNSIKKFYKGDTITITF